MKSSRFFILALIPWMLGCGVYSFTGVAITAETLSIQNFYNDADGGPPDMAQIFTNQLMDYFQQNTNLTQVEADGELQLEGAVTSYRLTPVAPAAAQSNEFGDISELTRLTITVTVSYVNVEDENFNFENRTFSFFEDFPSEQNITAVEAELIDRIYEQIILDIFNATVANW